VTREIANPDAIIKGVLEVYKEVVKAKSLRLDVNLRNEVGKILVDPERFEQVVRNLVSNAIDASPLGEVISVETGVSIPGKKAVETAALASERYFQMKVRDHGSAIREKDLHMIFSPFFTTKDYGTGIGLTVSKKIVEAHNRSISVHSDETGTTFIVWIPLLQQGSAMQRLA
jgi:signal transduction histidine kinase